MEKLPFIHLFKTSKGFYIYDVNTDKILKVNKEIYEFLYCNKSKNDVSESQWKEIEILKENGYLKNNHIEETEHPITEFIEFYLKYKLNSIVLQVTQNCNMKCDYCVYSGNYKNRGHTKRVMTWELAKKSIDFMVGHSQDSRNFHIAFYGGEPLLEFDLVKKCMEYATKKCEGKKVFFSLTTNATLLSEKIVSYFEKYEISIMVSLDGPKEIHDASRRFVNSNLGSHDSVIKKLTMVKSKFPEFYKNNVTFNTVLDSKNSFFKVDQYFLNTKLFDGENFTSSLINYNYANVIKDSSEQFIEEMRYELFKVYLKDLGLITINNTSKLLASRALELKYLRNREASNRVELPKKAHHGGPCIPGIFHTFIDVDGNFYPCERVSELSEVARIGDIENGFDINKVTTLLNIEKVTEKNCHKCWAYDYCKICISFCDNLKTISHDLILAQCASIKGRVEEMFKDYTLYIELGYDFELQGNRKQFIEKGI